MEIGMLWFDNDKGTSIPKRIEKAARYYRNKYGVSPDLCYIHPQMVKSENGKKNKPNKEAGTDQLKIGQILVLMNKKILPGHFWIGVGTVDDPIS